ncbi:hypothetical protein TTHERM_000578709 (macronuclear) [Tetrahymena thermophila SB210]|uniref:Uncharacterized protein n=1 Tax=Tetrahymena thermophila (strain SB210) TaxID=312017 RepID=W7XHF1_TETTS|nr:hypothetical protein TTHERM_000578709 [Tetrahymena thermophila SB210]EWS72514.1 hypothetical protein TTHERM_000578709 [Tetrahymena thermophila SB210]|eukprot:XP_012654950.1 hypothetical protein TTHERM_000578709 [Tetrahymena thermophila SB210]
MFEFFSFPIIYLIYLKTEQKQTKKQTIINYSKYEIFVNQKHNKFFQRNIKIDRQHAYPKIVTLGIVFLNKQEKGSSIMLQQNLIRKTSKNQSQQIKQQNLLIIKLQYRILYIKVIEVATNKKFKCFILKFIRKQI